MSVIFSVIPRMEGREPEFHAFVILGCPEIQKRLFSEPKGPIWGVIAKSSPNRQEQISIPAGSAGASSASYNLKLTEWESDMNNNETVMDLEPGVLILGLVYASSLISMISWLA